MYFYRFAVNKSCS